MPTSTPTLLAIDAGTTGVTAIAFDMSFRTVARAYAEFEQSFPQPGWVEHEAPAILGAVDHAVQTVLAALDEPPSAIGITNQRETVFAVDGGTGEPLAPGIVWQDRRTAPRCEELRSAGLADMVASRTGLVLDPYFSGTKMEWLRRENAAVRAAAEKGTVRFVTVDALVIQHLTGGENWFTDPTNASRTMLFDIERGVYDTELMELFGVDQSMLAEVKSSADSYGQAVRYGGASIPITGVLGDQQAALFGQGGHGSGALKTTYGTGCFLVLNTGEKRIQSSAGLLTTLCAGPDGGRQFALEGSAFAGGSVVQWLRDGLGILDAAADSETLARSVEDTAGVVLVPAFAGLGAPYWDPEARAAILGLTRGTERGHIVRAGLDAIAHQCTDLVEALRQDSGEAIDEMLVDGGAAANDYLMQRQADLAGLNVVRPAEVEATARGAAAIAAVGAGLIDDIGSTPLWAGAPTTFTGNSGDDRTRDRAQWKDAVARVRTQRG